MNPRKKQILDAAHQLFINKGFNATSIQDILEEAKIAKGTFYNHFGSKNECLITILDQVHEQTQQLRRNLMIGQSITNPEVFIQQILIRMRMTKEHNLLNLLESIQLSNDKELKAYSRTLYLKELHWAKRRMVDLFGNQVEPYALDYAIFFFGAINHFIRVKMMTSYQLIDVEHIIRSSMQKIRSMLTSIQHEESPLFPHDLLQSLEDGGTETKDEIKENLLTYTSAFKSRLEKDDFSSQKVEVIDLFLEELRSEHPRDFLLESLIDYMEKLFRFTPYLKDLEEMKNWLKKYFKFHANSQ